MLKQFPVTKPTEEQKTLTTAPKNLDELFEVDFFQQSVQSYLDLKDRCTFFNCTSNKLAASSKDRFKKWLQDELLSSLRITSYFSSPYTKGYLFVYTRSSAFALSSELSATSPETKDSQLKWVPFAPCSMRVKAITVDRNFLQVCTADNQVLGFDDSFYDDHRKDPEEKLKELKVIKCLPGKSVRQLATTGYHNVRVTHDNTVQVCGSNFFGQLGLKDRFKECDHPAPLPGIAGKQVAVDGFNSFVLTTDLTVFSFGKKIRDAQGLGNADERVPAPEEIKSLSREGVEHIASGFAHCLALTRDGRVFGFGDNYRGQLGLGDNENRLEPTLLSGIKAQQIAAGLFHSLILTPDGKVFAFGHGPSGQLGLGAKTQQPNTPQQIKIPGHVLLLTTHDCCSLFVTKYQDKIQLYACGQLNTLGLNSFDPVCLGDLPAELFLAPAPSPVAECTHPSLLPKP